MTDLAAQILAHLDKIETDARKARGNHIILSLPRMAGKATARAHLDNWTPDVVIRRCAADRATVTRCQVVLSTGHPLLVPFAELVLIDRARGYGIQPTPGGDHA